MEIINLNLEDVLKRGMLPVIRKRTIAKARVLSRDERLSRGNISKDIELVEGIGGKRRFISRKELLTKYTYLDGSRIKLAGWKSNKVYNIMARDNSAGLAVMIPLNCRVKMGNYIVNGSAARQKKGNYIVGLVDNNGSLIPDTLNVIPAPLFRKMYSMRPNEVISRHRGSKHNVYQPGRLAAKDEQIKQSIPDRVGKLGIDTSNFDFGLDNIYNQKVDEVPNQMRMGAPVSSPSINDEISNQMDASTPISKASNQQKSNYEYKAIGRLIDKNGNTVGFILQNRQNKIAKISTPKVMELCNKHLVMNLMVGIRADTGKPYLRGNNIRIDMLKAYPLK